MAGTETSGELKSLQESADNIRTRLDDLERIVGGGFKSVNEHLDSHDGLFKEIISICKETLNLTEKEYNTTLRLLWWFGVGNLVVLCLVLLVFYFVFLTPPIG